MKRYFYGIIAVAASMVLTVSCMDFLKEEPKTFEQPGNYYATEAQVRMGANGAYYGYRMPLNSTGIGGTQVVVMTEFFCGYAERTASSFSDLSEIINCNVSSINGLCAAPWGTLYGSLNNANTMIQVLETKEDIDISAKARDGYLAEMYFLRALYNGWLVRYYGPVPLKTTPTTGFSNAQVPCDPVDKVLGQVISDLEKAEDLMESAGTPWHDETGRISKGAVKALLAKMYLTQAGHPIKDASAYKKAYDKALEVVNSGIFSLYPTYNDARKGQDVNGREYLLSIQCSKEEYQNPLHKLGVPRPGGMTLQPYISAYDATSPGGAWQPCSALIASYAKGDKRVEDHAWYFTTQKSIDGTVTHTFAPALYKYWDENAVEDGKSGRNFPLIRYSDVLLTLAEAACAGGSTSDAAAIDAYYEVRHRAMPTESKPASITFDQVFKERIWEQAFEGENWFTMVRTGKAFDFASGSVVDLVGYKGPAMTGTYEESDLLLPYPVEQVRLNPNLKR